MNRCLFVLVALVLLAGSPVALGRVWTDNQGNKINAKFVRVHGENVVLSRAGRVITVPFSRLSREDQDYLRKELEADGKGDLLPPARPGPAPRGGPMPGLRPLDSPDADDGPVWEEDPGQVRGEVGPMRTWTDSRGRTILAQFVGVAGDKVLLLKDGKRVSYPFAGFSAPDQQYVRQELEARGQGHLIAGLEAGPPAPGEATSDAEGQGAGPKWLPGTPTDAETETPTEPGMQPPGMPGMHPPGMPGMEPPTMPGMRPPGIPGMRPPGMPGMEPPTMPGMRPPGMPGMRPPTMPGMRPPGMSGMQPPTMPGMPGMPGMPEMEPPTMPGMPGMEPPTMPGMRPSGMPGMRPSGMPGMGSPPMPTMPEMEPPTMPGMEPPTIPGMPETEPPVGLSSEGESYGPRTQIVYYCSVCKAQLPDSVGAGDHCPKCNAYIAYTEEPDGTREYAGLGPLLGPAAVRLTVLVVVIAVIGFVVKLVRGG